MKRETMELTPMRLLQLLQNIVERVVWLQHNQLLEHIIKKFVHFQLLQLRLLLLHVVKFFKLIHL